MKSYRLFPTLLSIGIWPAALAVLWLFPPIHGDASLCPLDRLGLPCPGTGLGRSISLALMAEYRASFDLHPLGIPSIFILLGASLSQFGHVLKMSRWKGADIVPASSHVHSQVKTWAPISDQSPQHPNEGGQNPSTIHIQNRETNIL